MAMAFTAWLTASGPIAWISTSPSLRNSAAMAPATELGRDDPETLKTAMIDLLRQRGVGAVCRCKADEREGLPSGQ